MGQTVFGMVVYESDGKSEWVKKWRKVLLEIGHYDKRIEFIHSFIYSPICALYITLRSISIGKNQCVLHCNQILVWLHGNFDLPIFVNNRSLVWWSSHDLSCCLMSRWIRIDRYHIILSPPFPSGFSQYYSINNRIHRSSWLVDPKSILTLISNHHMFIMFHVDQWANLSFYIVLYSKIISRSLEPVKLVGTMTLNN